MKEIKAKIEESFFQIFASEGDTGFRYMFEKEELFDLLRMVGEKCYFKGYETNRPSFDNVFDDYWQTLLNEIK